MHITYLSGELAVSFLLIQFNISIKSVSPKYVDEVEVGMQQFGSDKDLLNRSFTVGLCCQTESKQSLYYPNIYH